MIALEKQYLQGVYTPFESYKYVIIHYHVYYIITCKTTEVPTVEPPNM